MSWIATHLISACLLPPLNLILLGGLGLLLLRSRPKSGRRLIALSFLLLYLISTPFASDWALKKFEGPYIPPSGNAGAIVVLGGGTYFRAPEYDGKNTVNRWVLERLRYATHLYRKTGKPVLVTGGHPMGNPDSEASQMKAVLVDDFHVPVAWTEDDSANTEENAAKSFAILKQQNIRTFTTSPTPGTCRGRHSCSGMRASPSSRHLSVLRLRTRPICFRSFLQAGLLRKAKFCCTRSSASPGLS